MVPSICRPTDQANQTGSCVSLYVSCYHPHPPLLFITIQPETRWSVRYPTASRKLSRPRHCSKARPSMYIENPVIQNAAARLVTGATRYEHMTPDLRSLHWLPVRHPITFKTAVTVYKCLHGLAPPYLTEYCTSMSSAAGLRHLRSAFTRQLIIPRTRTSYGDRSFAIHGPIVWNSLT